MLENYLVHYGTPGMRWGYRKKVLESISSGTDSGKRLVNLVEKRKPKKDLSKLTDDDLRKKVSRMNLERQYRDLSSIDKSKGANITRDLLEGIGATVSIGASIASIIMAVKMAKGGGI